MSQSLELSDSRILIIDDQKPFQVMLKGLLHTMGARQVTAKSTGESGVAAHTNQPFDILLVDYNLGHGKNGRQVLEELQVRQLVRDDTIFFLITGDNSRPMVLSALELQPDDYLMKPFSQGLLRTRLVRAFKKRKALKTIYQTLYRHQYADCIKACQEHIDAKGHYSNYCRKLTAELFLKLGQFDEAEQRLLELLEEQRFTWGVMTLARTRLLQNKPDEAIELAREVLSKNTNAVDAQDLIAECHVQAERLGDALESARKAVGLAPFSIERQSNFARIARDNAEFELARQAMHHVLEISRKSVFRDPRHLCTYIRSILDAAENADEPRQVGKYQTEATIALQRARYDDNLVYSELEYQELEHVVMARIESFNGRFREAQHHLNEVVGQSLAQQSDISPELAPDVLSVLLDLGEYEKANQLSERMEQQHQLDDYSQRLLKHRFEKSEERQASFFEANRAGISEYKNGDYGAAIQSFTTALQHAPMNSGAALNYIQAAIKVLGDSDKPNPEFIKECKRCFRTLEGMQLSETHQKRYARLHEEAREAGVFK
ncbi:Tetratricopeptide repeat-containing protein [Pseudidiomarina planktonica]|uniref:Tetratricopeptide repeat-containing protein n=1 Tax=Pseudidiomarina planktonica TaxID=1323738 RepID=A0A1Y6EPP9_9GAMM|nr:tetratricopeptide repeat-containing response regulator [Pseudidiomarina planktonica]RUO65543.1 response regulator [Pseudidiomarina planktonica]SMQ64537.1 Tetratricopeptide repeat-containing protein [Pseudidiomarina planktonica]